MSHSFSTLDWRLAYVRDLSFMYIYVCLQILDCPLVILQIDVLINNLKIIDNHWNIKFLAKKNVKAAT